MKRSYYTLKWTKAGVSMIDQRLIPHKEVYHTYKDYKKVVKAIKTMEVRGAPAIGVAAALGVALGFSKTKKINDAKREFSKIAREFVESRPTAVNIAWAVKRMTKVFRKNARSPLPRIKKELTGEALKIFDEDVNMNRTLSLKGQVLIKSGQTVLTHCNSGPLATAGFGTALGVIIAAHKKGKRIKVLVDETRPRLQGARLTAWELMKNGMDATLISDNMAGHLMQRGLVDVVITGADRIAANGDSANKIGTYSLSVLAKHHNIPFYIAAPTSTIDLNCTDGSRIPIEERSSDEVTKIEGVEIAPRGVKTYNPAFDVTPHSHIKAIVTEKGILRPPYKKSIGKIFIE